MSDNTNEKEPLISEESTKRKRKILTDPERLFAKCEVCKEAGNLDNMVRKQIAIKDLRGVELYGAFNYLYFCGENCQGLFV
jgi:hypothetical protein